MTRWGTAGYMANRVGARRHAVRMCVVLAMLAGLLPWSPAPLPAAAASSPVDVVFSLDGSGSIDSTDWQLQKDGYTAALQDAVAFPRDGSVAVGVNQWSSAGEVQAEVPLTIIDDQSDVDAIVTAMQGISQFQGVTDPVTGLDFSTTMLTSAGRPAADWTICMSTDGVQNDGGGSIGGSAANAQAAGVDRFSVIGIDDFGNGGSLAAFYGPAVFGGGTFTLARNTVEFANLIIGGCINDAVELVGIEVNQGIQNWKNTVPLVAAKPTAVRAFVQVPVGTDPQRVGGRLIGRRGGAELPESPLAATNTAASVLADVDIVARRAVLGDSLNFLLPESWRSGTVELELDGAGTPLSCQETAGPTSADCKVTVTFEPGAAADLKVIGVPFTDGAATVVPPPGALWETGFRVRTALPASSMSIEVQDQLFTTLTGPAPDLGDVLDTLTIQRFLDLCFSVFNCDTLYYGQLSGAGAGGLAFQPGDVAAGWDFGLHRRDQAGFFRNVAPHEVGHNLGLFHSVRGPAVGGRKLGPCGEDDPDAAPDFPYFGSVEGADRSLLGPDGAGDDDQNWGVDARFVRHDVNDLAVIPPIGPNATFDLMGYCWIRAPQDIWPADYTWSLAKTGFDGRFGATVANVTGGTVAASTTGEHLLFTGRINPITDEATIASPALVSGELPTPPAGDYELRLLDTGGAQLAAVPFAPAIDSPVRPGTGPPTVADLMFVVPVLRPSSAVDRVQVWHGPALVGEKQASPGVPAVATTAPEGGSTQSDPIIRFEWTGSDPDGDPLTYHVRYSHDDGTSWQTLAVRFAGTSIDVPRASLTGGTGAIFQVQASDGLNVSSADSPPFVVEGSGPVVDIASPVDGETFYSGVQQVLLEATAADNEDGDVSPSITWASDVDGPVFAGPAGSVGADSLSEGPHLLTATATDADGAVGLASVHIEVFRVAPPPPPPDNEPTTTSLASSVNPSASGQPVTFTATVSSSGSGTPTGTVTFSDGPVLLGSAPLTGGTASISTSSLGVGAHPVTAAYSGDGTFDPSVSDELVQTVGQAATTIVADPLVNLSRLAGRFGQFRATLTRSDPAEPVAGATVQFTIGRRVVCQATTDATGVATCPASLGNLLVALFSGGYTARFDGNADLLPSSARGAAISFR